MQKLGVIEKTECEALKKINTRKAALEELLLMIKDFEENADLYEKILSDYISCKQKIQEWWDGVSSKNNWIFDSTDSWEVKFETHEVFLKHN